MDASGTPLKNDKSSEDPSGEEPELKTNIEDSSSEPNQTQGTINADTSANLTLTTPNLRDSNSNGYLHCTCGNQTSPRKRKPTEDPCLLTQVKKVCSEKKQNSKELPPFAQRR
jgi:hypothetical protein